MISMNYSLLEVSASARRLADDRGCPESLREIAGDVIDLSALMALWPVPHSAHVDGELKYRLLQLCRRSGTAVCGAEQCRAKEGFAEGADCELHLDDRPRRNPGPVPNAAEYGFPGPAPGAN